MKIRNIDPQVTWEDVKKSRHTRRTVLETQRNMLDGGWERLQGIPFALAAAWMNQLPEYHKRAYTHYNSRTRPTRAERQDWFLSPILGVSAQDIMQLTQDEYENDPDEKYRLPYQLKLVLGMDAEEIQTLAMMHTLGA